MSVVCNCFQITEEEIREAIKKGAKTAEEVGNETQAGTGCGMCVDKIEELIAEETK